MLPGLRETVTGLNPKQHSTTGIAMHGRHVLHPTFGGGQLQSLSQGKVMFVPVFLSCIPYLNAVLSCPAVLDCQYLVNQ